MCAADDKTDFCILYMIHLILALSLTILLMFYYYYCYYFAENRDFSVTGQETSTVFM